MPWYSMMFQVGCLSDELKVISIIWETHKIIIIPKAGLRPLSGMVSLAIRQIANWKSVGSEG